jgi:hypothetical protein
MKKGIIKLMEFDLLDIEVILFVLIVMRNILQLEEQMD